MHIYRFTDADTMPTDIDMQYTYYSVTNNVMSINTGMTTTASDGGTQLWIMF